MGSIDKKENLSNEQRGARAYAYKLLGMRARSIAEMTAKLAERGFEKSVIEDTVEHLKKYKYLDDAKFARLWVESRMSVKPQGSLALHKALKEKGVDEGTIKSAIQESSAEYNDYEVAKKLAQDRAARVGKGIDKRKLKKRIYDYLIRRGFRYGTARRAIEGL